METTPGEPTDRSNRARAFVVRWTPWAASVAAVVLTVVPAYVPTVDGPQHLYHLHILRHYRELSAWYDWSITVGALGYPLILLPLGVVLPWTVAYKLSLLVVVGLWCSSMWGLARALNPRREVLVAVGAALAFQWSFYMGFLSFLIGTSLGLWAIALIVASHKKTRPWLIPSLLVASTFAHAFAGLLSLGVVAAIRTFETGTAATRLKEVARNTVPALIILAVFTGTHGAAGAADGSPAFLPFEDRLWGLAKMMTGGPWWRCVPPFMVALAGIGAVLSAWSRGKGTRVEGVLAAASLALFAAALFAPLHMPGWMHLSPRFLPLATVLGLMLLPVERIPSRWVLGGVSLWFCAAMAWTAHWHLQLQTALEPVLDAAAAPLRRTGVRLPILGRDPWGPSTVSIQNDYPYFDPLFNASLLMSLEQGGMQPYTFTVERGIHLFTRRPPAPDAPPVPNRDHYWLGLLDPEVLSKPGLRESLLIDLASAGSRFDDVILFGEERDIGILESLGYETDLKRDWVWIGHFQGCAARLRIEAPPGGPRGARVSFGWFPLMRPFWTGDSDRPAEGEWVVQLPNAPCGPIWVDVLAEGGRVCSGANKDGMLGFLTRTNQADLRCALTGR